MHPLSHIFSSWNFLLYYFTQTKVKYSHCYIFLLAAISGWLFPDFTQPLGILIGKPSHHLRCFFEEPFGLFLFILPVCGALTLVFNQTTAKATFFVVLLHIFEDYVSVPHRVGPVDPLTEHTLWISFPFNIIQSIMHFRSTDPHAQALIQEAWFIAFNVILLPFLILHYQRRSFYNVNQR
ncbi:hypothetical protein RCL1_005748 [Eukaryota sp. TZLM3-RCL]